MSNNPQIDIRDIFEDEDKLILLCKRFIEAREQLKREAVKNPERTPTPTLLAKTLNVPIEALHEIADVADNYLSDLELARIHERLGGFIDIDGNPTDPYLNHLSNPNDNMENY